MPVVISRSELLKPRLDRFSRALPGVEHGDIRAVHRARVASRRLRELIPVLQLDRDTTRKLGRRLRRITVRLGTVRELDVLLMLIDELHVSRRDQSAAIARVGIAVAKARDEARKRLFDHLPVSDLRKVARKLTKTLDGLVEAEQTPNKAAVQGVRWALDARVAHRAARLQTAIDEAGALYLPERLHGVRIALKKLRYGIELQADATHRDRRAELRVLKQGQEVLGRMHDLQILLDRVRQVQASLAPPNVAVWRELDQLVDAVDDDCRRLHARYMRRRGSLVAIAEKLSARPVQTPTRRVG